VRRAVKASTFPVAALLLSVEVEELGARLLLEIFGTFKVATSSAERQFKAFYWLQLNVTDRRLEHFSERKLYTGNPLQKRFLPELHGALSLMGPGAAEGLGNAIHIPEFNFHLAAASTRHFHQDLLGQSDVHRTIIHHPAWVFAKICFIISNQLQRWPQ
jgi:hypothetical protein